MNEISSTESLESGLETGRTTLFLVRHALTEANTAGRKLGSLDVELSEQGMEQARVLAERGRDVGIERVWTSPLARAHETGRVVAEALGVPLEVDRDLREMGLGPWEGLTEEEIAQRFPQEHALWEADPQALELAGHEGLGGTRDRSVAALESILDRGERALCVTHLTVLRVAWAHYTGRHLNEFATITPDHGEVFALERFAGETRWRAPSEGEE